MAGKKSKGTFIFYESFYNAIKAIDDANLKLEAYELIMQYGLYNKKIATSNAILKVAFEMIKPVIDNSDKRYITSVENGKKGGAPKGNKNAQKKQPKTTKKQPPNNQNNLNDNVNDNDNDNVNYNVNERNIGLFLSQKDIETFKNNYPNKHINEKEPITSDFDFNKLMQAINASEFLKSSDNLSFAWFVANYEAVINGNYKNFTQSTTAKNESTINTHNYTKEEVESFFTDLDKLEL